MCPVCRWPDEGLAACTQCDAVLRGDYVAGPASERDRREHAARLAASRRRYDLHAAVRASGSADLRDPAMLTRMAAYVRGDPPQPEDVERAAGAFDDTMPLARRNTTVGTGFPFTRLVAAEIDAIQFVALGPDAISVVTLAADETGVPGVIPAAGRDVRWQQVTSALPADDDLCRFWLAGGVSAAGPENRQVLMAEVQSSVVRTIRHLLDAATAAAADAGVRPAGAAARDTLRTDRVLVRRADRWPLLDAAVAAAQPVIKPVAEIVDLGDRTLRAIASEATARAPLRYEYAAMLVNISTQGVVSVVPRTLFPAGTVLLTYDQPTENLRVRIPPAAARRLTIPVVAKRGFERALWPQVDRAIIDSTPAGNRQLKIQVRRPGEVTFLSGAVTDDGSLPPWPDVMRGVPPELASDVPADLVLLVELGPTPDVAAARLDLLDALVDQIKRPEVRVAVVGYRDHFVNNTQVKGSALDSPPRARQMLRELRGWEAKHGSDHAAPLEDALHWVATQHLGWRPGARHLLLVCGSRPPHSHQQTDSQAGYCVNERDWETLLARLRNEYLADCLAVVSEEARHDSPHSPASNFWELLCTSQKPLAAESVSAEGLARSLQLTADRADGQLCLARLADDAEQDEGDTDG